MKYKYYAGNGTLLVAFEKRSNRDAFVAAHPSWGKEKHTYNEAKSYPQFYLVTKHPYCVYDDNGNTVEFWCDEVSRFI